MDDNVKRAPYLGQLGPGLVADRQQGAESAYKILAFSGRPGQEAAQPARPAQKVLRSTWLRIDEFPID